MKLPSSFTASLGRILKRLNPAPPIGGLEISESALRYARVEDGALKTAALRLPPGILAGGRIKDAVSFIAALKSLRGQIPISPKELLHVIVSFPAEAVYAQAFTVPVIAEENLEEAAQLNLKMISPLDPERSYSDWQRIGEVNAVDGGYEALGVFIERAVSDDYLSALKAGGFVPVAAEFPALSLTRLAKEWGAGFDRERSLLIINLTSDGIDYAIVRGGELYFDYFVSWRAITGEERRLAWDVFTSSVVRHLQQVMTFHSSRFGGQVKDVALISQGLEGEITNIVTANFPDVAVRPLTLRRGAQVPAAHLVALGAALRGLIPRGADTMVSVLGMGTEVEYRESQLRLFVAFWRNAVFASFGFMLVLFLLIDIFLARHDRRIAAQAADGAAQPEVAEVAALEGEARAFNRTVTLIAAARGEEIAWSPLLRKLQTLALAGKVTLTRIAAASRESPMILSGAANAEEVAVQFRKLLEDDPQIESAELPLSLIVKAERGVTFTVTITLVP